MFLDRRQFHRVSPDYPLSVLLGEYQHSLVFDFCEGGLAVVGLAARELGEVVPLTFDLPEGHGRIEGRTEIVWTNESGHRTGLHFFDLAESPRQQLSDWISAKACTTTEKETIQPLVLTRAIGIALATVLLSSALGFIRYYCD
jgi:PilZ domain